MPGRFYCRRCDRIFNSARARAQHYEDSGRHNTCNTCSFDGYSWDDLLVHHRLTRHSTVCQGCNDGEGAIWVPGSRSYLVHLETENVCSECEEHFTSFSNLQHHKMVHLDATIECYGCDRMFTTYAGMIIHLESGSCESGIDGVELNESAAMCYQWHQYIDDEYRDDMLDCLDLNEEYLGPVYPYMCPTCDNTFSKLSGVFQHVWSPACEQELGCGAIAKLVRWLKRRHA